MFSALLAGARGEQVDPAPVIAAMRGTIQSNALDPAFKGEALTLPSEGLIGDRMELVDPDAIHDSREALRRAVGSALADDLARAQAMSVPGTDLSPEAKGVRRLKSVSLALHRGRRSGTRRCPGQGPVRRRRQYDRPAGSVDGAGQPRRAGARSRLRRILSSGTRATAWFSTNGSRCRLRPSAPTRSTWSRRWPGTRSSAPATPTAGVRWSAISPPINGRSIMVRAAAIALLPT